jgi:predicted DNA-binding transcriptional regulator YafY
VIGSFRRNFKDMIGKSRANPHSGSVRSTEISAGMHERLVFMDFRCFFLGELRRTDLMGRFGISTAAATRDIAYYRRVLGGKIQLDPVRKVYQSTKNFSPMFVHDVQRALAALFRGFGETQTTKQRPLLPCEIPPRLCNPRVEIVAAITRAINQKRPVEVRYSSFSSGETTRQIAFDRKRHEFIDLVLTRIHDVRERHIAEVDEVESAEHDLEWGRVLELELVPHPKEKYPAIVAMDYSMKDEVVRVRVRAALASYLLRQWIVDCSPDHSLTGTEYRLWLRNAPILYGIANAHLAPGHEPAPAL